MPLKQGKFDWYIKSCHLHISPILHVTFAQKITFIQGFIGRWARLYQFWPQFSPFMSPKQGKFRWYIKSCHLHILPTTHVTFAQKITFIQGFIRRWARFYPFWTPFCLLMSPKQGKFGWYIKICHMHNLPTIHVTFGLYTGIYMEMGTFGYFRPQLGDCLFGTLWKPKQNKKKFHYVAK